MDRLPTLINGELQRLKKYNLFTANFVALLFWLGGAWFFEGDDLRMLIPFIFLMDSTMMTLLMVGATLFYEKKEHTINSIMVSPVTEGEYLTSKIVVNMINSLFTVVFVSAGLFIMKGVTFNYFYLVTAVMIITIIHTLIGIWLSYYSKDFTSMLVYFITYTFIFLMPSILLLVGVIPTEYGKYLILLPPEASSILINASVAKVDTLKLLFGYIYLSTLSFGIYRYIIKPKFNEYTMKETGV